MKDDIKKHSQFMLDELEKVTDKVRELKMRLEMVTTSQDEINGGFIMETY